MRRERETRTRDLLERAWFRACLTLGGALRAATYSTTHVVHQGGGLEVRKRRRPYAPLLVAMSQPLVRLMDTGVRVLPQKEWEERECRIYRTLHDASVEIDGAGVLVLPYLTGRPLAALLEDPALDAETRKRAVTLAVTALADFHGKGFTHGDAMADNVMVDPEAGVAQWFDFETVHDARRPMMWRRADDVRALLATCIVRTAPADVPDTLRFILDAYRDESVTPLVAAMFASAWQRPLIFHLGQAWLPFTTYREISRLLAVRCPRIASPGVSAGGHLATMSPSATIRRAPRGG